MPDRYKPRKPMNEYPTLDVTKRVTRIGADGEVEVGVPVLWGPKGSAHHTTLWEDWASRPQNEIRDEAFRRLDEAEAFLDAQRNKTPSIADLMQQLDDIDDEIRQKQRQRLDVEEQIAQLERAERTPIGE